MHDWLIIRDQTVLNIQNKLHQLYVYISTRWTGRLNQAKQQPRWISKNTSDPTELLTAILAEKAV